MLMTTTLDDSHSSSAEDDNPDDDDAETALVQQFETGAWAANGNEFLNGMTSEYAGLASTLYGEATHDVTGDNDDSHYLNSLLRLYQRDPRFLVQDQIWWHWDMVNDRPLWQVVQLVEVVAELSVRGYADEPSFADFMELVGDIRRHPHGESQSASEMAENWITENIQNYDNFDLTMNEQPEGPEYLFHNWQEEATEYREAVEHQEWLEYSAASQAQNE